MLVSVPTSGFLSCFVHAVLIKGSTVVACWTAGQQVEWSILHQGHDSYQKFISLAQVVPGPV